MTGLSIMGLLPPGGAIVSGSIKLDGRELVGLSDVELRAIRGNDIAMIFQDPLTSLDPTKTIGYQVAEPVRLHQGAGKAAAMARATEVLGLVGLPRPAERLGDYPHQLSGGMRQRVMIAMALTCEPKLLIADEPTTALDVTIQDQILRLLSQLCRESGVSLVFVTHDLPVVAQICQRVSVMYGGQLVESGAVGEVLLDPRHPYTLGLVRSAPDFDYVRESLVPIPGAPPSLITPPPGCRFHPRCEFAEDDCRVSETPLRLLPGGRATACLHYERCIDAVAADRAQS
jgi:peptide/nickel transport system ATP-binding protein